MVETFETLKTKIGDWVGVDIQRLPEQVRGDALNLIQRQVTRNHDLRYGEVDDSIPLTASVANYTLPANWRNPISLWYINPVTSARIDVVRLSKDEFDIRHPVVGDTGTPINYTIWGSTLSFGRSEYRACLWKNHR